MSETSSPKSFFDKNRRAFLLRKLHSLSGVVPVGGFLVFHLWENARALDGQNQFDEMVEGINHMPYLWALEGGLILLPLAFHAIYGVKLALESKPNVGRYSFTRNWMYTLQRVTGLLAFAFIGYHLYELWFQKVTGKLAPDQFYTTLCATMASTVGPVPVVALVYILGIAASVFHFANGLWGFCFSWGITVSRRAQRMAATVFGIIGLIVFFLGANTAIYFATGARFAFTGSLSGAPSVKAGTRTCADLINAPGGATAGRQ